MYGFTFMLYGVFLQYVRLCFLLICYGLWGVGSIKACKNAALKCEDSKFEQYKLGVGASLSAVVSKQMQDFIEKIKMLEH